MIAVHQQEDGLDLPEHCSLICGDTVIDALAVSWITNDDGINAEGLVVLESTGVDADPTATADDGPVPAMGRLAVARA